MSQALLKTKLYAPPVPSDFVKREHLVARLRQSINSGCKLSLVSAPAGYGKSTLLSECVAECGYNVGWLSLDGDDNDSQRFFSYVVAALQSAVEFTHGEVFGQSAVELLQLPTAPSTKMVVTALVNSIAELNKTTILVLDDFHVIDNPEIFDAMAFLLKYQPQQLHIVIATRIDPPLALAQLRARRQMTEIRISDMRFSNSEAQILLNDKLNLELGSGDLDALNVRTEGWIAGLQLAALALQHQPDKQAYIEKFTGSLRFVLDYLTEEILHQQSESTLMFMIRTAILDKLNASLCAALTDTGHDERIAGNILNDLHHANLFIIPLDEHKAWFRYHHLFAELLRNILCQRVSNDSIRALHIRASHWYAEHNDLASAIKHALQAQDFPLTANLITKAFGETISVGDIKMLLQWSNSLPEDIIVANPRLLMHRGWAMFLNGQYPQAVATLQQVESILNTSPLSAENQLLRAELSALLATFASIHQDVASTQNYAQVALQGLPADKLSARARALRALAVSYGLQSKTEDFISTCQQARDAALRGGNLLLASEVMSQIAFIQVHKGDLNAAQQEYQAILDLSSHPKAFPPANLGYIGLAMVALERNQLQQAQEYLEQGIFLAQRSGITYMLRTAYCVQAILMHAQGEDGSAIEAFKNAQTINWMPGVSDTPILLIQYAVRLYLMRGEVNRAVQWASGSMFGQPVNLENPPDMLDEIYGYSQGRVLLAQGNVLETLAICGRFIPQAMTAHRYARVVEFILLKAMALYTNGETDGALRTLHECLRLAMPSGYIRLFLEAGEPLPEMLQQAHQQGMMTDYIHTLLMASGTPVTEATSLVEQLTPRELHILRLISEGLSNQQICDELYISLNTVKKHCSNIFGKLGVKNRTQAVAQARALNLLI